MTALPARSWRRLAALLVVLAGSLPFLVAADRVELDVDGEVAAVRVYDDTVADVLDRQGVEVADEDLVLPSLDAVVTDGMAIRVVSPRPVSVLVQGVPRTVMTTASTVAGLLADAGLDHVAADHLTPRRTSVLNPRTVVRILVPLDVAVTADGETTDVEVPPGIVADALAAADVELGPDDEVDPPLDARLEPGTSVVVNRITAEQVVDEVELPFETTEVDTDDLYVDESEVAQEGAVGLRHDVYRRDLVDGEEVGRELVSSTVVREPQDRVVRNGTAERPAPPPPPPAPAAAPSGTSMSDWDRLAQCESGGNWSIDSTYDGGLQFHPDTWNRWKPAGYPDFAWQATREQQITVGKRLHAVRGWAPWPSCSRRLGLR